MLPLDLGSLVLGYGRSTLYAVTHIGLLSFLDDGHLRRTAISQMTNPLSSVDYTPCTSKLSLQGYITSLHATRNERTGEQLIVSGADDGTVAIWSSRSVSTAFIRLSCPILYEQRFKAVGKMDILLSAIEDSHTYW
jgi:hypothetical protein